MTDRRPLRLLQLTDPHLFEDVSGEIYGLRTDASFRAALDRAFADASGPVDALLVTGDIADDGRDATYERFRAEVSRYGLPVLCLPGNHESPERMADILGRAPLQYCGSADFDGWRIVMLDSHIPGEDGGRLSPAELRRLDQALAGAGPRHVLVGVHHQPLPMGSPWLDSVGLANADEFLSILRRHSNVRAVLWGHVHQASDRMHEGMRMMSTPSTCAQFTPNTQRCIMDLRPPGFRWLELSADGRVDTGVVWLDELRRTDRPPDDRQQD